MLPIRKIVAPTDFSEASLRALAVAREWAMQYGAELLLMHVLEFPVANAAGYPSEEEAERAARQQALQQMERLIATHLNDVSQVRCIVRIGSPFADYIVATATDEKADLIVIATHGLSGWRHLVLGSVVAAVARTAPIPVLTVRSAPLEAGERPGKMLPLRKILCPVDFSELALSALQTAYELAAAGQAELIVLHVVHPSPPAPISPYECFPCYDSTELDQACCQEATEKLQNIAGRLSRSRDDSTSLRLLVRMGVAADEVLLTARDEDVDLIVMSTHGHTGWRHFVFGSVTENVLQAATRPVLTICPHEPAKKPDAKEQALKGATAQEESGEKSGAPLSETVMQPSGTVADNSREAAAVES